MSNSPLVSYKRIAKHYSVGRRYNKVNYSICRITIHCVVGRWSAKEIADYFATTTRSSSPNYGVGVGGDVSLCVDESNRSYCSSSGLNDAQAITIECASDVVHPYAFPDKTYAKLIDLCVDICKRNGKNKVLWFGDKNKALNYKPAKNEMVLTIHRWFAAKACPGDWFVKRLPEFANEVNRRLGAKPVEEIDMTKEDVQKLIDASVNAASKSILDKVAKALEGNNTTPSEWAAAERVMKKGQDLGITDGSRPQGYAKREEVVAMILRSLNEDE